VLRSFIGLLVGDASGRRDVIYPRAPILTMIAWR
jgi:hypothetical protein